MKTDTDQIEKQNFLKVFAEQENVLSNNAEILLKKRGQLIDSLQRII